MRTVDVPERFLVDFMSELPSEDTLADLTTDPAAFGRQYAANVVKFTAFETARRVNALGVVEELVPEAATFFGAAEGWVGAALASDEVTPLGMARDTLGQFNSVANSLGAFTSIPILGLVLGLAEFALGAAQTIIAHRDAKQLEGPRFAYSRDSDEDWVRQVLKRQAGTDYTSIFGPVNDAAGGVGQYNVELASDTEVARQVFVPEGASLGGLGCLPSTSQNPRGWEVNLSTNPFTRSVGVPWVMFSPAFQQAGVLAWNTVLANGRQTFLVDAVKLHDQWTAWDDAMVTWGWGQRYSDKDAARIRWLCIAGPDAQKRVGQKYRRILQDPHRGMKAGKVLTWGGVARWSIEQQLQRRQRKYLGTLTVAYCSETDPAFASDPELRELLRERRAMLLNHKAKRFVDLEQVPDADYRSALAKAQLVVGDLAQATPGEPGPAADVGLALAPRREGLPVVKGPAPAGADPILGVRRPASAAGNLLALALLRFLVPR